MQNSDELPSQCYQGKNKQAKKHMSANNTGSYDVTCSIDSPVPPLLTLLAFLLPAKWPCDTNRGMATTNCSITTA